MSNPLASTIRDSMELHVGFCLWSDDVGGVRCVVSARDNNGQNWVSKHKDFYLAVCSLAEPVGFESEQR